MACRQAWLRRLIPSVHILVLLGLCAPDVAADGHEAPLKVLHSSEWEPSFEDFFLAAEGAPKAMESSGPVSPDSSPDVAAYTASIGSETGAMLIAVGRSDSTIMIGDAMSHHRQGAVPVRMGARMKSDGPASWWTTMCRAGWIADLRSGHI